MNRIYYKQANKRFAQKLRREMTPEERHLWYDFLSKLPVGIRRQKQIGPYIVDFYCAKANLVIELDGFQHYTEVGKEMDLDRDAYMQSLGLKVIRIDNLEIKRNFNGVCQDLLQELGH